MSFSVHNHESQSSRNEIKNTVSEIHHRAEENSGQIIPQTSVTMSLEVAPEFAKKMILIEPRQLDTFKENRTLSKLEGEMREILHSTIADGETTDLYSNNVSRYLDISKPRMVTKFKVAQEKPSTTGAVKESVKEWNNIESMVIDTVPKTWKSRA